jgi:hypothetical protein
VVKRCLDSKWQGRHQQVDAVGTRYVLFFDGGSRGNTGPGGAGAVIVCLGILEGQYQIVWAASMSYAAAATTNNYAENMGLLTGIKACVEHEFTPVHIVGEPHGHQPAPYEATTESVPLEDAILEMQAGPGLSDGAHLEPPPEELQQNGRLPG